MLARVGWNVEADGLFGAPPITVTAGDEAHPTVLKALGMLGLGRTRIVRVPVDGQGRMRSDALPAMRGPTIVVLQAGNLNTGAFDPVEPIIAEAHARGAWVHIDGAFGLWAKAAASLRHLAHGLENADSWATDVHKWLNVPYDSGLALVREWCGVTVWQGRTAMRISVCSWATSDADVERSLDVMLRIAAE